MVYEISYANDYFKKAQEFHVKMAKRNGEFDEIFAYGEDDLHEDFRMRNRDILKLPRGGYWIWKAHIINSMLEKMKENDYLLYADAGAVILHSVKKLISVMEKNNDDIMVFEVYGKREIEYTKRAVFRYFHFETEECLESNQIMGGFILVKKNMHTVNIFREYEKASQIPDLLLDGGIKSLEYDSFVAHRHDQSILSVLLKKNGIKPYRDPSQWGLYQSVRYLQRKMSKKEEYEVYKRSEYPKMMFYLHRSGMYNPKNIMYLYKNILGIYVEYIKYWLDNDKVV